MIVVPKCQNCGQRDEKLIFLSYVCPRCHKTYCSHCMAEESRCKDCNVDIQIQKNKLDGPAPKMGGSPLLH